MNVKDKKYYVLGADNVGTDITVEEFGTYSGAYAYMERQYEDFLEDNEDDIESSSITESGASVLMFNNDYYYWNLKSVDVEKTIPVNNGDDLQVEYTAHGLRVTKVNGAGEVERRTNISDDEVVMLFNLYEQLLQNNEKSAYILSDFSRKVLKETRADDFVEEYRIIQ